MSRRKVRGLTKTGRQVSEDPDLDSLLSNLSPEEMEELQKEVSVVPDPDPSEIIVVDQIELKPSTTTKKESQPKRESEEFRSRFQRNFSTEGEPKKESRKQEYLRKMGLSQETNISSSESKDDLHGSSTSPSIKRDGRQDSHWKDPEGIKGHRVESSRKEDMGKGRKVEVKETEQTDGRKLRDRRETQESGSSKTKDLITRLQERKEDKNRKEDGWKKESGESKAKEMISRIQEKEEKERERKEEMRRRDENKTKFCSGRLAEKQNQVVKDETGDTNEIQIKGDEEPLKRCVEITPNQSEEKRSSGGTTHTNVEKQTRIPNDVNEAIKKDKTGNCVTNIHSKNKTKEEEEEDESASMFDEDLERVHHDDPGMTELNVNNSEVIKTKTLIQFAGALKHNTHIRLFSLANCRADDHVAYAIADALRNNKSITSINLDSNLLTSKGIMAVIYALQYNSTLTELRFHNQRHIIGGKSEMEMTKVLKENTTLLKLGYHFELAGPRMTMTNILSRNMDRQRQKRLQEQKQASGDKKDSLEVPKAGFGRSSPKPSPIPSPIPSPSPSPKLSQKKGGRGSSGTMAPPPPPPGAPPPPPPPMPDGGFPKNSLTPVSQRKFDDKTGGRGGAQNSRDQLLASIRGSNITKLKKVALPKLLQ